MHYVIVGNGVAGITAAFTLRDRESDARITVISGESNYFFSRTALMYAFMDRLNLRDLEPYERKVYKARRIELVKDWVADLDARARALRLKSGATITYDRLLLATGSVPRRIEWPGLDSVRDGVVHFVSLQDLQQCERLTSSTRDAVVVGGGLIGIELVECLRHHGVNVTFLVKEKWYWPVALDPEEGAVVADHARRHAIDLRLEEEIAEVLCDSEGRVRSVKTILGNEFPAQILGITIGVRPAIDWMRGLSTPLAVDRGVVVDAAFRTSVDGVYAAGDCAQIGDMVEQIWYSAKRQGELAARSMLGDPVLYRPPVFYNSAKFFDIEYTTVGDLLHLQPGARSFFYRAPGKDITLRLVEVDGVFAGCNMLGSRWDHTLFERWIEERRPPNYVIAHLESAQFDVEFGRFDLRGVKQAFQTAGSRAVEVV
jgi:NAD(P)H-nitrite reductase large subunit